MAPHIAILVGVFSTSVLFAEGQLPWVNGKPVDAAAVTAEAPTAKKAVSDAAGGARTAAKPLEPMAIGLPMEMMMPSLDAPAVKAAAPAPVAEKIVEVAPAPAAAAVHAETPAAAPAVEAPAPREAASTQAAAPSAIETNGVCHYVVKKGDNLSRILLKLGLMPIYGSHGNLRGIVDKNKNVVQRGGDLIFPQVRLAIPRHLVAKNEMCVDGSEEKDVSRRIALYSEAEAEIHRGQYSVLCDRVRKLSFADSRPDYRGRLMHLAAVCHYEENNLPAAHRLWEQIIALHPDASLMYRATYNMALVECQTEHAMAGYEKLRGISPELWQTQATYERRTFLDLATYCAEKGVGPQARLDTLIGVYLSSPEPELRSYAEEKLRGDFTNTAQCKLTETALARLSSDPKKDAWEDLWENTCD